MKLVTRPISSGRSIFYDSRGVGGDVQGSASTAELVGVSGIQNASTLLNGAWDDKELVVLGGTCAIFGEIINHSYWRHYSLSINVTLTRPLEEGVIFSIAILSPSYVEVFTNSGNSTYVDVGISSTTNVVIALPPDGHTSASWVGKSLVLADTSYYPGGIVPTITACSGSGYAALLDAPLPTIPSDAEFVILSSSVVSIGDADYSLPEPSSLRFSTSINSGYESCSATVDMSFGDASNLVESLLYKVLYVYDDYGRIAWEGEVVSAEASNSGLSIEAMGYYNAFNNYVYSAYWPAYDENDALTTTNPITVLKDILSGSVVIAQDYYQVDGDDTLLGNHLAHRPYQFDFSETTVSAKEALDDVLKFGDGSSDFNPVYLQVWDNRTPVLAQSYTQATILNETPKWSISSYVDIGEDEDIILSVDGKDMKNKISVVYTDLDTGGQHRTAFWYDYESVISNGARETVRSQGSMDSGNAIGAAGIIGGSIGRSTKFSPVTVYNKISEYASGVLVDLHLVRSGDIIIMPLIFDLFNSVGSSPMAQSKYVIARTSYDAIKNSLTIEPHIVQNRIDTFLAGVI
jgi:hypothetical protein